MRLMKYIHILYSFTTPYILSRYNSNMSNDEFESVEETPESIEHEEGRENLEENVDIDSEQSERTEQTEQRIQDQAEQPIEHQEEEQQQNQDEIELKKVEYEDLESDSDFGSFDEASLLLWWKLCLVGVLLVMELIVLFKIVIVILYVRLGKRRGLRLQRRG